MAILFIFFLFVKFLEAKNANLVFQYLVGNSLFKIPYRRRLIGTKSTNFLINLEVSFSHSTIKACFRSYILEIV